MTAVRPVKAKKKTLERILADVTPTQEFLFVYGTLLSDQPYFEGIRGKVRFIDTARTHNSVLLLHDLPHKQYPFLINNGRLLHQLRENTGIEPHDVIGELYEVTDEALFLELDPLEGIVYSEDLDSPEQSMPLTNLYQRRKVSVTLLNGKVIQAHSYVANPKKSNVQNLVDRLSTKVVVPKGDWHKYVSERSQISLRVPTLVNDTVGMETEFSFLVDINGEHLPLPCLKSRGSYKLTFREGRTLRYRTLTGLLSQALFSALRTQGVDAGVLTTYYERKPEVNTRFLIPSGMAYVDGEFNENDGLVNGIQRLHDLETRRLLRDEDKLPAPKFVSSLPDEFKYFEVTGFPAHVEKGFATKYAASELVRRHVLSLALEDIIMVHHKRSQSSSFRLVGNSSQYSFVLDPYLALDEDSAVQWIDLSVKKVPVKDHTGTKDEVSKFTRDVAYVLGKTFGPLLSYLLSGIDEGYVEFKTRPNGRLEYRNTVVQDPWQLAAGLAIYAAAVRTVEKKIKQYVLAKTRAEHLSFDKRNLLETYKTITADELVSSCDLSVDVLYADARFRPGFLVPIQDSYHGKVRTSFDEMVDITDHGEMKKVSVRDLLMTLYHDADFQEALSSITDSEEKDVIEKYLSGAYLPESHYQEGHSSEVTSRFLAERYMVFTGDQIRTSFLKDSTFIDYVSRFIFDQLGETSIEDGTHRIEVHLNGRSQHEDSEITIGSVPLEIRLLRNTAFKGRKQWEEVDKFGVRLDPVNYRRLQELLTSQGRDPHYKVWEVFYKLK